MNLTNLNIKYITDSTGEKKAVILPIAEFEEMLEDLEDLVSIAERQNEATTDHEDFIEELKRDGLLSN
ncbi:MAG TPA: hypothetical protein V6C58_13245 [Allocoleopsis sp.]